MRVLFAPTAFAGTLTARQAAQAMADGWRRQAPDDELTLVPLSDGGRDLLDVLDREGTTQHPITVTGPDGAARPATLQVRGRQVQLSAEEILGGDFPDLGRTSSVGLGEALLAALDLSPERITVGLGVVPVHDGGAGMLAALGVGPERLRDGGAALTGLTEVNGLGPARERFTGVTCTAAIREVGLPLLGLAGTSALTAGQRGATSEQAQHLEQALADFAHAAEQDLGAGATDLLGGDGRLRRLPGAGAGGGLGFGLAALGFELVSGPVAVADAVDLTAAIAQVDLVVTGEGCFDWRSLRDSVPAEVATRALSLGVPALVVAGQVEAGRRETTSIGIEAAYPLADSGPQLRDVLADPVRALTERTARLARNWSR